MIIAPDDQEPLRRDDCSRGKNETSGARRIIAETDAIEGLRNSGYIDELDEIRRVTAVRQDGMVVRENFTQAHRAGHRWNDSVERQAEDHVVAADCSLMHFCGEHIGAGNERGGWDGE